MVLRPFLQQPIAVAPRMNRAVCAPPRLIGTTLHSRSVLSVVKTGGPQTPFAEAASVRLPTCCRLRVSSPGALRVGLDAPQRPAVPR